jgi:hypothetical protein
MNVATPTHLEAAIHIAVPPIIYLNSTAYLPVSLNQPSMLMLIF